MNKIKKKLLERILLKGCFGILTADNLKKCDSELLDTIEEFSIAIKYRYNGPRSWSVPKSNDWYLNILPVYDEVRFKSCVRVTRWQFGRILNIIKQSDILKNIEVKVSIEIQLAVALYRFGNDGSGASYRRVAHIFGISDAGMIQTCTDRVIKALLSIRNETILWPTENERRMICNKMIDTLPGCIGYVDGCHIPLFEAPKDNHEAYYSRKQQYAIHLQGICDNNHLFRNVSVGYPASAHDARVFANTPIGQKSEDFLSNGQWIAGDSAYKLTKFVITPFRENSNVGTPRQRRIFNRHFSSQRVKIEQSFGMLKKIFGSLRSLRVRVNKLEGHKKACEWIVACIILYNIIRPEVILDDEDQDTTFNEESITDNTENENDTSSRDSLFQWFLERYMI